MKRITIKSVAIPYGVEEAYILVEFREKGALIQFVYDTFTDNNKWHMPNVLAKKEIIRAVVSYRDLAEIGLNKNNLLSRLKENGPTRSGLTRKILRNFDQMENLLMPDSFITRIEFSQPTTKHTRDDRYFRKVDACPVAVIYNTADLSFLFDGFDRFGYKATKRAYQALLTKENDNLIHPNEMPIKNMRDEIFAQEERILGGQLVDSESEDELV